MGLLEQNRTDSDGGTAAFVADALVEVMQKKLSRELFQLTGSRSSAERAEAAANEDVSPRYNDSMDMGRERLLSGDLPIPVSQAGELNSVIAAPKHEPRPKQKATQKHASVPSSSQEGMLGTSFRFTGVTVEEGRP